jgi:hypothetical protein
MSRSHVLSQSFSLALHERNERITAIHRARASMHARNGYDAAIALYVCAGVVAGIAATFLA